MSSRTCQGTNRHLKLPSEKLAGRDCTSRLTSCLLLPVQDVLALAMRPASTSLLSPAPGERGRPADGWPYTAAICVRHHMSGDVSHRAGSQVHCRDVQVPSGFKSTLKPHLGTAADAEKLQGDNADDQSSIAVHNAARFLRERIGTAKSSAVIPTG